MGDAWDAWDNIHHIHHPPQLLRCCAAAVPSTYFACLSTPHSSLLYATLTNTPAIHNDATRKQPVHPNKLVHSGPIYLH
ncbi:hypothetical protein PG987_003855 [Apiospora arundinis]